MGRRPEGGGRSPDSSSRTPAAACTLAATGDPRAGDRCAGWRGLLFRRSGPWWRPRRHARVDRPVPGCPRRRRSRAGLLPRPQPARLADSGHPHWRLRRSAGHPSLLVPGDGWHWRPSAGDRRSAAVHSSDSRIPFPRLPLPARCRDTASMACAPEGSQGAPGSPERPGVGRPRRKRTGPPYRRLSRAHQASDIQDVRGRGATGPGVSGP